MIIAAQYIYTNTGPALKNGLLHVHNGRITKISQQSDGFKELAEMKFYNGILIPPFVTLSATWESNSHMLLPLEECSTYKFSNKRTNIITDIRNAKTNAIFHAMIQLCLNNPGTLFDVILKWFTLNPALENNSDEGTITIGKRKVMLIENFNFKNQKLAKISTIKTISF